MTNHLRFLNVSGNKVFSESGDEIRLRGFCLGSWLNMEAFMVGFPGTATEFRREMSNVLGEAKSQYYFDRFLHHFAGQADFDYVKSLGCNLMRVAFNYRHFEDDDHPFDYKPEGFKWLDKVIGWARNAGVYVSLDFHAFPGWQSRGWHCDNPAGGIPQFWEHIHFEDRAVALWEEIARRYKDEPTIAMYGIMNEPEAYDPAKINRYYERVTQAIRAIDNRHILNFEGNFYSVDFSQLNPPPDDNVIYSSHLYVDPGLDDVEYSLSTRTMIEKMYHQRRVFCLEHNVPHYLSEFGPMYSDPAYEDAKLRVIADFLDVVESYEDHWTIWNYKDIGKMGIVTVDADSLWMQQIRSIHQTKTDLRCDAWVDRSSLGIDAHLQGLLSYINSQMESLPGDWSSPKEELEFTIGDRFLSRLLLPAFAEQFRDMSESEIDEMMASFAFENCYQRQGLAEIVCKITGVVA